MEKVRIFLGDFPVEQATSTSVTINVGRNVRITMHISFPHTAKEGSTLPLFTEIPYADPRQTPIQ
jgi:hypothetical protein